MHLIFQQYLERYRRLQATESAIRNMTRTAELFEKSGLDPEAASDIEIEEWLAGLQRHRPPFGGRPPHQGDNPRGRTSCVAAEATVAGSFSPRTVRLHAENLSAVFNYAVRRGLIQRSPMETVRLPREADKEPRILQGGELRHILANVMTDAQELLVMLLMYTGMRRNEIRHLEWDDLTPTSIRVKSGKGGKLRYVPMHPALGEVIITATPLSPYVFPSRQRRTSGLPMSEATFSRLLEDVRGDVLCSFHDFRRTVASSLFANGVDTLIIDKILGWAPRTVGSRYYIASAPLMAQEAILKLYADDPVTTPRVAVGTA